MAFSSQGDRIALTQIEQMIDGQYYKLGYYDTQADNLTWFDMEKWDGGKVSDAVSECIFHHTVSFVISAFGYGEKLKAKKGRDAGKWNIVCRQQHS